MGADFVGLPSCATPPGPPLALAARLPHAAGVYRFRDAAGKVLYLGRAVSLRRRVVSYWGDLGDRAHLAVMVGRIADAADGAAGTWTRRRPNGPASPAAAPNWPRASADQGLVPPRPRIRA
jgi:hypothetical protein